MEGVSLFTLLLLVWAALTVVLVGLWIYRAIIGMQEEDQIFLDRAEAALEQNQIETLRRINRLDPILKGFAIASGGLLLILGAVWLYQGLYVAPTL
ncbi:MAG: hypothetical protein A3J28_09875 [Acidobacteria bacterium RIFCSPLOWO2_12_FULL_60_22]|nr:MAG: hypothetical protein A3J28_09875 [Acidobacteria bacterium RIFCSPLOWO2_12_FULL_60_22]